MAKFKKAGEWMLLTASFFLVAVGVLVNFRPLAQAAINPPNFNLNIDINNIPSLNITGNSYGANTDAIAIRIVPNASHLSIDRWYASQGFSGSPQKLLVDGYEAIRDNRTVYVAGTNINQAVQPPQLYFNIYIITYNQGADAKTVDIFGKILSNWRFNNNLSEATPGTCSLPAVRCLSDADCGEGSTCLSGSNSCSSQNNCRLDTDCPAGTFCVSEKAKLQRDIKRFGLLNEVKDSLAIYRSLHQRYPTLLSGTYLPGVAISTWPSWQSDFLTQLNLTGLKDPINKLGICNESLAATSSTPGYESQSCFNSVQKRFYKNGNNASLELPHDSFAIAYTSDPNGSNYNLCAAIETNYQVMSFVGGAPVSFSAMNCAITAPTGFSGNQVNNPAQIVAMNLGGQSGEEFNGYVRATDPEGNPINFQLDTTQGNWSSWSAAPVLQATNDPNQKKIWAATAGTAGTYPVQIVVEDNQQLGNSTTTNITITGGAPTINAGDAEYNLSTLPDSPLVYDLYFTSNNFNSLELSYGTSLAGARKFHPLAWFEPKAAQAFFPALPNPGSIHPGGLNSGSIINPININCQIVGSGSNNNPWRVPANRIGCNFNLNNGLKGVLSKESEDGYHLRIYGTMTGVNFSGDTNFNYKARVINSSGQAVSKEFKILVKRNLPQLDYGCSKLADLYESYNCQINNLNSSNASTTYTFTGLPQGLTGTPQGLISGQPLTAGDYSVQIQAKNEYNFSATSNFDLKVENACGRNLVYYQGGPWDASGEIRNQGGYYRTILIGDQCWLADNLNVGARAAVTMGCNNFNLENFNNNQPVIPNTYINGTINVQAGTGLNNQSEIAPAGDQDVGPSLNYNSESNPVKVSLWQKVKNFLSTKLAQAWDPSWNLNYLPIGECYNSSPIYCEADGRLYTISEANYNPPCVGQTDGMRGPCPAGWHVPADSELHALELSQLGQNLTVSCSATRLNAWDCEGAGAKLKPFGGSGFSALLSGKKSSTNFQERTNAGYFWSSTKVGNFPVYYQLTSQGTNINKIYRNQYTGPAANQAYNIRCIKDKPCMTPCATGQYCSTLGQCANYLSTP
ncbi:MAG TPA: FISUMP domain-containing protein [bacterium]|nr:FISUMP domain-containing protein [bacterium]HPT29346.1 FISUMP domain-containing protein [bacterium]